MVNFLKREVEALRMESKELKDDLKQREQCECNLTDIELDIRQNGIEIAKVRHLVYLNEEHFSQNLKAISDNKIEIEATIDSVNMDLEASIRNVESNIEDVKTDLEASILSVEALVDSIKTGIEASIDLVKQEIQQNVAELASSNVNSNSIAHASNRIYVRTLCIIQIATILIASFPRIWKIFKAKSRSLSGIP